MRTRTPSYEMGQWNAACDRCGGTFKSRQIRTEWTGLRVCRDCWDPRHPQDFAKGKRDDQAAPWVRPRPDGIDVSPGSGNEISEGDV